MSGNDAHWTRKLLLRTILKVLWSRGALSDLPRLRAQDVHEVLDVLLPGDVLLIGNGGYLSHLAMYVGDGRIVHSMATEKTNRGASGSLWDALRRPFRALLGAREKTGVLDEPLATFVERFHRDCLVGLRWPALADDRIAAGLAHIESLVGKDYDYDFADDDDEYYCTEIAVEFLRTALPAEEMPELARRRVRVPVLLDTNLIEPIALLNHGRFVPVVATAGAARHFAEHIADAVVVGRPIPTG